MSYVTTFLLAMSMTALGFLTPGMLNMTALKRSLRNGRKDAFYFSLGVICVTLVQAFLAVTFARWLSNHPVVLDYLTYAGIVVFLGLAVYFYRKANRPVEVKENEEDHHPFQAGLTMASMNMMAIPFFAGYSLLLTSEGWLEIEPPYNYIFPFGAVAGAFLLLLLYTRFAEVIEEHVQFIAKHINQVLAILFLGLAVAAGVQAMVG